MPLSFPFRSSTPRTIRRLGGEDTAGRLRINGVNETKISAGLSASSVLSSEEFHDSARWIGPTRAEKRASVYRDHRGVEWDDDRRLKIVAKEKPPSDSKRPSSYSILPSLLEDDTTLLYHCTHNLSVQIHLSSRFFLNPFFFHPSKFPKRIQMHRAEDNRRSNFNYIIVSLYTQFVTNSSLLSFFSQSFLPSPIEISETNPDASREG